MRRLSEPAVKWSASLLAALVLVSAVIAGLAVGRLVSGSPAAGCDAIQAAEIDEIAAFTPYDQQRSHLREVPLNPSGASRPTVTPADSLLSADILDGLPLQLATGGPEAVLTRYFLDAPIDSAMTLSEFLAAGGVQLHRDVVDGWKPQEYAAQIGERALLVPIGGSTGVLTWGDPISNGLRPHHLSWIDGDNVYTLIADRPPAQIVNLGRGMACS